MTGPLHPAAALQLPVGPGEAVTVLVIALVALALGAVVYRIAAARGVEGAIVLGGGVALVALVNFFVGLLAALIAIAYVYVQSR